MGHPASCSNSNGDRCECSCGGWSHGGGSVGAVSMPGAWSEADPGAIAGSAAEWFTANADVYEILGRRAEQAVRSAIRKQPRRERRLLRRDKHHVCKLLVDMADALAELTTVPEMTATPLPTWPSPASTAAWTEYVLP